MRSRRPLPGNLDPDKDDDRAGLAFFGTSVVSGNGTALVTATGARTSYGAIAHRLAERAPETDFQHGVRAFGLLIGRVTLILVVGVFAINVALHRPLFDALLFSIALAVGLTPELLPAIVTLNLTRGARALTAHGVLVKRLPAIQNLGSVTVLCTDKTGTLTLGKLELVKAVGIDKDDAGEASNALELAYLNSHFESSFQNPLDTAVLAGAPKPADLDAVPEAGRAALRLQPADAQRRRPARQRAAAAGDQGRAGSGRRGIEQRSRGPHRPPDPQGRARSAGQARRRFVGRRLPAGRGRRRGCSAPTS